MAPPPGFNREDLLTAWLDFRGLRHAHEDLWNYHLTRLHAYEEAFGVDLERGPGRFPDRRPPWHAVADEDLGRRLPWPPPDGEMEWLQGLLRRAADAFQAAGTPFDDYLETPSIVLPLSRRRSRDLREAAERTRLAERALLLDILELLWGLDASTRVSSEEVRRHGFDPAAPAPDPLDYW